MRTYSNFNHIFQVTIYDMGKRKSTAGEDKTPSKDKMDVDGEDSGSDDDVRWDASTLLEYER
jgi:hypothetical protein